MSMTMEEKLALLKAYEGSEINCEIGGDINNKINEDTMSGLDFLRLFAELVKTGEAWTWSGYIGRIAADLVEDELIAEEGEITQKGREWAEGKVVQ